MTLKGENLNLLAKLETAEGMIQLAPALPNQTERTATIQVENDLEARSGVRYACFRFRPY